MRSTSSSFSVCRTILLHETVHHPLSQRLHGAGGSCMSVFHQPDFLSLDSCLMNLSQAVT
jgi:hypothetical protein